ncbi:hypothetical protein [Rhodococcus sp. P1Y]|uniref:hypothetical protein n=1 Tax=Rhodococcus sp. P1Y TaxID=1302308 RepID=UPI001293A301|nr:hypothetical protein [Rhodococcus sp. P1Y]
MVRRKSYDAKAEAAKILDDAKTEADKIKAEGQAAIKAPQDTAVNGAQTKLSISAK